MTLIRRGIGMATLARLALLALLAAAGANSAIAQADYPNRPVRIIVPFGAGGAADSLPRLVGQRLAEMWGQPVVVENRTGAAGNIGMEAGARAAPDGYTLTSAPNGNLTVNPHLYSKLTFDVFRDFTPITLVAAVQNVLVVNPAVPADSLAALIAHAKANPGKLTCASGGNGTQAHMGCSLLRSMAEVDVVHVPYKGVGDALKDLLGGQTSMMVAQLPAALPLIQAGKLRALGVASRERTALLPTLPTIAATLPGFEAVSWYALVGPAGMPREVAAKIQTDVAKVVQQPDIRERLQGLGAEAVGSTQAALVAAMRADFDRYGAIIGRMGIRAD